MNRVMHALSIDLQIEYLKSSKLPQPHYIFVKYLLISCVSIIYFCWKNVSYFCIFIGLRNVWIDF